MLHQVCIVLVFLLQSGFSPATVGMEACCLAQLGERQTTVRVLLLLFIAETRLWHCTCMQYSSCDVTNLIVRFPENARKGFLAKEHDLPRSDRWLDGVSGASKLEWCPNVVKDSPICSPSSPFCSHLYAQRSGRIIGTFDLFSLESSLSQERAL